MSSITSPLKPEDKKVVGQALQGALVDLLDLSLLTKQAHWNVIGHNFRTLHLQLDKIVSSARKHSDTVAERAVAMGCNPDGRSSTIASHTEVPQLEAGYINDGKVVAAMTDILGSIIRRMRERIVATEKPDLVTQDLLIEITQDLEKHHWMIEAQR
ncbi:DNA starvation/stationary phase protection protein [Streptosporangium sp. NBC_01755]|uniref:Dps family protein n=1 Tax=unclassified Streptosporangium TaxID=2632669 RepID=UPI002DD80614|nr:MULTISPECIES: DNA starvation/stationary phase protection protein [unclassified Streptosporangium]WSA22949.1 DNA starvation/stationary phase protection protein [Streptosporangium sp. NBC_01810]WSC98908.1 DNA starvation/stationary phase protection protein [Streptosporangium sp. NBC_01755]